MAANQPTFFNNAHNFNAVDCTFTVNGRTETFDKVLVKLKEAAALGINYDSFDHAQNPVVHLDQRLASIISPSKNDNADGLLYFFSGIWPSDVQACGEMAARFCKDQHVLHATIFVDRLLSLFPGQGKKRLVPTLAYQLAASPYAPQELKIEILRALFLEPDIPQHNLTTQFEKLIIDRLQSVSGLLPPVIFVLDSVHNIHCDGVMTVITELVNVLVHLRQGGVVAKTVITGLEYRSITKMFRDNQTISRIFPIPTNPSSFLSMARTSCILPVSDWLYSQPRPLQFMIGTSTMMCASFITAVVCLLLPVVVIRSGAFLPTFLGILGFIGAPFLDIFIFIRCCIWQETNVVRFLLARRFDEKALLT